MIELTLHDGKSVWLAPDAIASITEAGAASQWFGTRSFVRTFDGRTFEARETASQIAQRTDTAIKALENKQQEK